MFFFLLQRFQNLRVSALAELVLQGTSLNRVLDPSAVSAVQIDASKILSTLPEDCLSSRLELLASSAVQQLGFPPAVMKVEAQVAKLLLFEVGDHHKGPFDQDAKPGNFEALFSQN